MIEIRPLKKCQLARRYGWETRRLMSEVRPILPKLEEMGYRTRRKTLTAAMVAAVVMFLGEPAGA